MIGKSSRLILKLLLPAALLAIGCGCKALFRDISDLFQPAEPIDSAAVAKYWDGPRIGPGMGLAITVGETASEKPPVSMKLIVDQKGELALSYLLPKPVPCDGLTLDAFKQKLVEEYSVFIRQPQVTVEFVYDGTGVSPWGTVTVMGEVGNPGPVNMPRTMDLTVTKVLQLAGGVKQFADKESIRVTRCDKDGIQTVTEVDLIEIGSRGRFDKDMVLRAGDVIYVPPTWY